jgi:hypothetical protein
MEENNNLDWIQGIPNKWLKKEWQNVLVVVQSFYSLRG